MPGTDGTTTRRRQILLSSWLMLTGCTVGLMLGFSMYLRLRGAFQASRDWLGWGILIMLLSVYVSDIIRGVRRVPGEEPVHCAHCALTHPVVLPHPDDEKI